MTPSLHQRTSAAAHASLQHANPLSLLQFSELVRAVAAASPRVAVDIGCGFGPFAIALASSSKTSVIAYDINGESLERARVAERRRSLLGSVEWVEAPFLLPEDARFDAVACIGSSHAIGSPVEAIGRCSSLAVPNGIVVFAELVWRSEPDPKFVEFLGVEANFYWKSTAGREVLKACALDVEQSFETSKADFQAYEDAVRVGRYAFAETLSQADRALVLQQADDWSLMYDSYGRHCLGFDAYVARRVAA